MAPRFPTLRSHDWPDRDGCRPLLPAGPADLPLVSFGAEGIDPDAVVAPCRTVAAGSGHVVLDYDGPGASEQVLSEARLRALSARLDSPNLVVCLPHPGRLFVSTTHPVAVATLAALGQAAYDVVDRNGGPRLSRRLYFVAAGRITEVFEPGTLAARRAAGVSARRPEAPGASPSPPVSSPGASGGVVGWLRRVTGA